MSSHVSMRCPHCREATEVTPAPAIVPVGSLPASVDRKLFLAKYAKSNDRIWWIGICNACRNVVLVLNDGNRIFPQPQPSQSDRRIPEHIRADLDEAKLCFSVGALRGTATLSRRALQSACILKGAPAGPNEKLWKQINWLRDNGYITEDIKVWAHEVRYGGNDGAHPPEDPADDVITQKDAENVLELTEELLSILFVTPAIAAEQRKKRLDKGTAPPPALPASGDTAPPANAAKA